MVPLDKIFSEKWLNATTTLKSIKEDIYGIYERVNSDLKIINADTSGYAFEMKEEYLKAFDFSAAIAKKQQLEETERKKSLYEEQRKKEAEERTARIAQEAAAVENAGKVAVENTAQMSYIDENGNPVAELPKERILAITFKISARESRFMEVNRLLSQIQKLCESFNMLEKEEL